MANLRVDKITSTETFEKTGSVQFDGSSDYLSLAVSSHFQFGSGDFTIECWALAFDEGTDDILGIYNTGNNRRTFALRKDQTESMQFLFSSDGSSGTSIDSADGIISLNTWHHYAVVRKDLEYTIYLDGKNVGSRFSSDAIYTNTDDGLRIGSSYNTDFDGHISNVRIIKGKALYTTNFKPSMKELEVTPETVLLACQSKTDAILEKTGKTLTANGNAVASELTPGILTPVPKAGAGSAITGSVEFDGTGDYLSIAANSDFNFGSDNFTIEGFFYKGGATTLQTLLCSTKYYIAGNNGNWILRITNNNTIAFASYDGTGNEEFKEFSAPSGDLSWHHFAFVREGTGSNQSKFYFDGVLIDSMTISKSLTDGGTNGLRIGEESDSGPGNNFMNGFLSNIRIVKGTALYTDNFIPPTRELKKVPGTVLLCCQDENSVTTEATGKTITSNGDPAASNFTPQVGDDRKVTFEGVTKINTENYFYLPTGDTVTRNTRSGRGLFGAGSDPSKTNSIDYVNINSTGNAQDFGDLTEARDKIAAAGSSTRGLFAGGDPSSNTIAYVTIATRGNALNFGDLPYDGWGTGAASNDIRWLNFGDYSTNRISYVTIATTGDAQDFGDLLTTGPYHKGCGSSVRAIIYPESGTSDIQFLTFSSTGNAISFGDKLDSAQAGFGAASDSTRAIRFGGRDTPGGNTINAMGYVTIASTGNAKDFGDLTSVSKDGDATSNSIRAVHNIGNSGSVTNSIDYVTVQTTGNAKDFGDLTTQTRTQGGTTSDSHGGVG